MPVNRLAFLMESIMNTTIQVAVAIIARTRDDGSIEYFLTKRHKNAHQGGKWEFPGGKVEASESVAQALARELKEEVAIEVLTCQPFMQIEHLYRGSTSNKHVTLNVFIIDNFSGEPNAQEGQEQAWYLLEQLVALNFPEANQAIIEKLLEKKQA
jgi:8-oxo-dGTP diphosphatase